MYDRLKEEVRKLVLTILAENREIDFHGFYAAKVVKQNGQKLELVFDDQRLKTKGGVDLHPALPGWGPTFAANTRVLVGWQEGDPSKPYVVGVWLGNGGLVSLTETFSQQRTWNGPNVLFEEMSGGAVMKGSAAVLLDVQGDLKRVHDIGGGAAPQKSTSNPNVTVNDLVGAERLFTVTFTVAMGGTAGPLFTAIFARQYALPPHAVVSLKSGTPFKFGGYISTPVNIIVSAGETWAAGQYEVTVQTGA
jgi:hypothetical protein